MTAPPYDSCVLFEPALKSSVDKVAHCPSRFWSTWVLYQVILRIRAYFESEPACSDRGSNALNSAGPPDLTHLCCDTPYTKANGITVDWFEPELAPEKRRLDWTDARILRFRPRLQGAPTRRTIIFFGGGGFTKAPLKSHSFICAVFAHRLNAQVLLFPYKLAPTAVAASEIPKIVAFYLEVAQSARLAGHELILAGDSAGGSIVAGLPQAIHDFAPLLSPTSDASQQQPLQPDQLILISPVTDLSLGGQTSELMNLIAPYDWWLTPAVMERVTGLWLGQERQHEHAIARLAHLTFTDPESWRAVLPTTREHLILSPVLSDAPFQQLQTNRTAVSLVGATNDILYVHAQQYAKRCEANRVSCTFIEGVGGVHVYSTLAFALGDRGSWEGAELIVESVIRHSLKRNSSGDVD